jgi:hypothetical protein
LALPRAPATSACHPCRRSGASPSQGRRVWVEPDLQQGLEPVALAPQQGQFLDPPAHRQVLALDDARHLLGRCGAIEQAERDVRLERLRRWHRIQHVMEFGQLGRPIGRLGEEMEVEADDAVDHEPEAPPVDGIECGSQCRLAVERRPEDQREMRTDQVRLLRMILRPHQAQGLVVLLAQDRPGDDEQHRQP